MTRAEKPIQRTIDVSWRAVWRLLALFVALAGLFAPCAGRAADATAQSVPVYLYASPATAAFFDANESDYNTLLGQWRVFLKKYGKDFREIGRADLLSPLPRGVLVLGSALLLDDEERRAIDEFGRRGGSILGTWATGARDGTGNWRGFQFVQDTFELRIAGQIGRDSEEWFMMPMGDGPLTWPLPSGRRMYLGKVAENLLRIDGRHIAARYAAWDRSRSPGVADGAIAFTEKQGSRRIYLGFAESAMDFHAREDIYDMLDAMVSWLRREPRMYKAAWPEGKVAAQLIAMEVDGAPQSSGALAQQLEELDLRATFFLMSSQAIKAPDLLRSMMRRNHEIAYHADAAGGFKGQRPELQEQRMLEMFEQMRRVTGPRPGVLPGLRASAESYDQSTEILMRRHGLQYHAADSASTEDRLPFFSRSEKAIAHAEALIVLPRTSLDDAGYRAAGMNSERAVQYMMREFDAAVEMGALNVLSIHSSTFGNETPVNQAMPSLFRKLAELRNKVWTARGDDIAAWWRNRERVNVKSRADGRGYVVELTVAAPGVPPGLTVMTTHADAGRPPVLVEPMTPYTPSVSIRPVDAFRSAIVLNRLSPGTHMYRVRF
jgi:peptidoglycan/xylan/chitin deacetylase (PgdA/CDA1 family)